jgi:hypothetical protein
VAKRIAGLIYFGAYLSILLAIGEYFHPITNSQTAWAEWASLASLALLALLLVAVAARVKKTARVANRPLTRPEVTPPPLSYLDAPGNAYVFTWRQRRRVNPLAILGGLLLCVNLMTVIVSISGALVVTQAPPATVDAFSLAMCVFLGIVGFLGPAILIGRLGIFKQEATIRVDAAGVTSKITRPHIADFIPWSDICQVYWSPDASHFGFTPCYVAVRSLEPDAYADERRHDQAVVWPTDPQFFATPDFTDGAQLIGPDELAALVAERIGQPVHVIA